MTLLLLTAVQDEERGPAESVRGKFANGTP